VIEFGMKIKREFHGKSELGFSKFSRVPMMKPTREYLEIISFVFEENVIDHFRSEQFLKHLYIV
jgi:hypothetical protein